MFARLRRDATHRGTRGVVGARDHHAAGTPVEQCRDDGRDLVRRLALGEHGLRCSLTQFAVDVDPGEAELVIGHPRQTLEPVRRIDLARPDRLEQRQQVCGEPARNLGDRNLAHSATLEQRPASAAPHGAKP